MKIGSPRLPLPCRQNPRRKYDPVNIEISPVTGMPEEHGGDCGKGNKLSIKNRVFTPVSAADPHPPKPENHHGPVR